MAASPHSSDLPWRRECLWVIRGYFDAWLAPPIGRSASPGLSVGYRTRVLRSRRPAAGRGVPKGTLSQIIECLDHEGRLVAQAHRYYRPLSGSTMPDPKWLAVGAEAWIPPLESENDHECGRCPEDLLAARIRKRAADG